MAKKEIERLKQWIEESDNIVFLAGQEYLRKAGYRIFAVWTVCTIKNMTIRRKRY